MSQTKVQLINNVSGNSGFGLASATGVVHLHKASSDSVEGLKITNSTTGTTISDGLSIGLQSDEDVFIHNYENTSMLFGTNDTTRLTIANDGKVGIGTSTPSALLEVIDSTSSRAYSLSGATELVVERASDVNLSLITTNTHNSRIRFGDTDDEDAGAIDYDHNVNNLNFFTNGAFTGKIDSAGKLIMGDPTSFTVGTSVAFSIVTPGRIQSDASYSLTTSSSANVHIGSNGLLRRSTSSARYKKDIIDATWGLADVLKLRPKTFKSNATGEDADDKTYGGFIAEDVHDIGLTNFVEYNDSDQPDAIHYGNMVSLLTKAIQELNTKITTLETKVAALEAA